MDLMSRTLNKLDAFLKGKRVMRTIPSSALPKGTDLTKYKIKSGPQKDNLKPFVRVQVKNISEI
jgi:hypothetical protein